MLGFQEPFLSAFKEYEYRLKKGIEEGEFQCFTIPQKCLPSYIEHKQKHEKIAAFWRKYKLDLRLGFVAQWVLEFLQARSGLLIDIGTDHAHLPSALLAVQTKLYAIAIDIHPKTATLAQQQLCAFPERVIKKADLKGVTELILQPNTHLSELKSFLIQNQWQLCAEEYLCCDHRIFVNLRVSRSAHAALPPSPHIYQIPMLAWRIWVLEKNLSRITQEAAKIYCQKELNHIKQEYQRACTGEES
jgi:tRNA A22 N-methylase